jgi:hypothetical protein
MTISDYLNKRGKFALITLPYCRTTAKTRRGMFNLIPKNPREKIIKLRSRYSQIIRRTAVPKAVFGNVYYMPNENEKTFRHSSVRVYDSAHRIFADLYRYWSDYTTETLDEMLDTLRVRWTASGSDKSMEYCEYVAQSKSQFRDVIKEGPVTELPKYTFFLLEDPPATTPTRKVHHGLRAVLWNWMMDCEEAIVTTVTKGLQWLADRPGVYRASTDAIYVRRKYGRDVCKVPVGAYCTWLNLLGRIKAAELLSKIDKLLADFHAEHRGENKLDASYTTRKAAIKLLSNFDSYIPVFLDSMKSPLNVDALVEKG